MDDDVAVFFRIPYSEYVCLDGGFLSKMEGVSIRCIKDE